jgi:hypothetical protein
MHKPWYQRSIEKSQFAPKSPWSHERGHIGWTQNLSEAKDSHKQARISSKQATTRIKETHKPWCQISIELQQFAPNSPWSHARGHIDWTQNLPQAKGTWSITNFLQTSNHKI